jgi:hypothetical protein
MSRPSTAVACLLGSLISRPAPAQEPAANDATAPEQRTSWALQLEAGSEYDSNVHRLDRREGEDVNVDGSPVARLGARHRLAWRRTDRERLALSSHAGLKMFGTDAAQSENVAILSADGTYEWGLPGRGALVGLNGTYYDAIPYHLSDGDRMYASRHFRIGGGEGTATLVGASGHRLTAMAGYRAFRYKPNQDFDWRGEHVGLLYQGTFWRGDPDRDDNAASIELSAGYRIERRGYEGPARTNSCADQDSPEPSCSAGTELERADLNHSLAAEVLYTGRRVYSARYELQVNDSNSFGESLVRQRLQLDVTTELFRDLFLTAEATVLVHIYLDPLLVARDVQALTFVSIDEENRNSLSLHLSRAFGPRWSLEGRYAIYSNEFTNQELTFRRQTAYLGVVYRTER